MTKTNFLKNITIQDVLILVCICILSRYLLESFSSHYQISLDFFIHNLVYYFVFFMYISLIFFYFTKLEMLKSIKISFLLSPIILIPPILDLIISFGKGIPMTYYGQLLEHSLLVIFFGFFPQFEGIHGLSIGLRMTVFLLLLLIFMIAFKYSNKNILQSILAVITVYCTLFVVAVHPFLLSHFNWYEYSNKITTQLYLMIFAILVPIIYYHYDKEGFNQIKNDLLLSRVAYQCLIFIFGFLYIQSNNTTETLFDILLFVYSLFLMCIFSIVTNNLEDVNIDKLSNPNRSTLQKNFSKLKYQKIGYLAFMLGFLISILSNIHLTLFLLLWTGAYYIYSCKPFRLKRIPFISKLVLSLSSLFLFMGGYFLSNESQFIPTEIIILYVIFFTLAYNIIDIKDYESDKKNGVITIVGLFSSLFLAKLCVAMTMVLLYGYYIYLTNFNFWYILTILCIINVLAIVMGQYKDSKAMGIFVFSKLVFMGLMIL